MSDLKTLYDSLQRAFYAQPPDLKTAQGLLSKLKVRVPVNACKGGWF